LWVVFGQIRYQETEQWKETMSDQTYYTVLGISETASQDEIDRAYRSSIEAYQVLSDSTQRSTYDQQLAQGRRQNARTPSPLLSCEVFSKRIGCSVDEAKDLLAGRLPITLALARKLQSELGASVEFWISQPFEADSPGPFAGMAVILFFIGVGYTVFSYCH